MFMKVCVIFFLIVKKIVIKQRAQNNELVSQINVVLNNDNWNTLTNKITIAKTLLNEREDKFTKKIQQNGKQMKKVEDQQPTQTASVKPHLTTQT